MTIPMGILNEDRFYQDTQSRRLMQPSFNKECDENPYNPLQTSYFGFLLRQNSNLL